MTMPCLALQHALKGIVCTAHDLSLLDGSVEWRRAPAGASLQTVARRDAVNDLVILTAGSLRVFRRDSIAQRKNAIAKDGLLLTAGRKPILLPPFSPELNVISETEVEYLYFSAADCDFLLTTCRAFRALVFAAAQAGVAQVTDETDAQDVLQSEPQDLPASYLLH